MSTTKRDLVVEISKQTGLKQDDVYNIMHSLFNHIINGLSKGERFELRNFCGFEVKEIGKKVGRDPNNPEVDIEIPPHKIVRFKASRLMREAVRYGREVS